MPFGVGRAKTVALVEHMVADGLPYVVLFTQRDVSVEEPTASDLYDYGTLARVVALEKERSGTYAVVVEGVARIRLRSIERAIPYLEALVEPLEVKETSNHDELLALGLSLREATEKLLELLPIRRETAARVAAIQGTDELADAVSAFLEISIEESVELLGIADLNARIRRLLVHLNRRTEVLRMRNKINSQVKEGMDKSHREIVLRQQLKAIQDELGNGESAPNEVDELAERIANAKLSPEASEVAKKQLKRLGGVAGQSPEAGMVRTYLEWILDLPWQAEEARERDIAAVRAVLDADHHGLEKVKKRILEYFAVRQVKGNSKGPILCLIGPPGVGKTSLGKSIARALGREFVRVSLGGVHDEAQVRGHRRTYVGALPGQIIQGMKKAGTTTPVFMLDEVDKLGSDYRGDPSSALLEVLDPEQNDTFADHYLEIPYDLSKVVFVATANVGDTIPAPLRDRMEIIEIPGYTPAEKLSIAKRHLLPKQLREHGLTAEQVDVTDEALETVIDRYTREAGVRSLERNIAAIVRTVVVDMAEGKVHGQLIVRTEEDLAGRLGQAKFTNEVAERTEDPGVATGLAWTPVGGAILFVEASKMPGKGKLTLTGQLGDVMKESAAAALTYVRANAERFGISRTFVDDSDIHIHVPAGAMPKDGPSAGVTMLSALVSLLTGVRVRHDVAMTGEITLRGRVLPIGGLKEKVLAAHRAGIKRLIVPERNRADLDDVPDEIKKSLELVFVSKMDQVIEAALEERVLGKGGLSAAPAVPLAMA